MVMPWLRFQALAAQMGGGSRTAADRPTTGWDSEGIKLAGEMLSEWSKSSRA